MSIDLDRLERDAARRGMSLSRLAEKARVSRNTMARIRRGHPVRADVAARLEETLSKTPKLQVVRLIPPAR